jgi:hypothetical protein
MEELLKYSVEIVFFCREVKGTGLFSMVGVLFKCMWP